MLSRDALLYEIMMFDFAVTDVTLFLDTHPKDKQAFEYYKEANARLKDLKNTYAKNYGSLSNRSVSGNTYNYVNAPWPWEGEKSCGCTKRNYNTL